MIDGQQKQSIRDRLALERGTLWGQGRHRTALVYPSPYRVGMSSLGYQSVYRILNGLPDSSAERAFLPDEPDAKGLATYESLTPVGNFSVVAFSVAYELEITGFFSCLRLAGLAPYAAQRNAGDPMVVVGGPLTFSNPLPLAPFADLIVMGEAEDLLRELWSILHQNSSKSERLRLAAELDGVFVPTVHGDVLPSVAKAQGAHLPARSAIVTSDTELSNMFLIETERGCSRACSFCVMRRSTNGGMRLVSPSEILQHIPDHAPRVGLVGAAVSDHPRIVEIVKDIVGQGKEVGLSSLRADRMTPEFVEALMGGGYRTLTIASDGASERLRIGLEKRIREKHLRRATELATEHGMKAVKTYMMVGVPGETDEDIDELIAFTLEQVRIGKPRTKIVLGIAPFVAKRNTPLDRTPFAGIKLVEGRLKRLRNGLKGKATVRPVSARWAWVEYELAQGGAERGDAAYRAWQNGGTFSAWKKALAACPPLVTDNQHDVATYVPKRVQRRDYVEPAAHKTETTS